MQTKIKLFIAVVSLNFASFSFADTLPVGTSFAYPVPDPGSLTVYNIGYSGNTFGGCPNNGGAIYTESLSTQTTTQGAPSWVTTITWTLGAGLYRQCLTAGVSDIQTSSIAPPQSSAPSTVFYNAGFNYTTATPAAWAGKGFFDTTLGTWLSYAGTKLSLDGQNLLVCFAQNGDSTACW